MQVFAGAVAKLLRGSKHTLMQAKGLASHYIMLNPKYTSSALLTSRATTSDVSRVIAILTTSALHHATRCDIMDHTFQPGWTYNENTHDVFDDLWAADIGPFDFQSALEDTSYAMPINTDDLNALPPLDDLSMGDMPFAHPVPAPDVQHALDTLTLEQLTCNNRPPPTPRQRNLPRKRSKYILRRSGSGSRPISIPTTSQNESPVQSLAIQRWQNSPPEEEAASLSAIYNAMDQPRPGGGSRTPSFDAFRTYRGPSSTTSIDSGMSDHSAHSTQSGTSQSRRRRSTKARNTAKSKAKPKDAADRIFKCTFCCDTFKHKYDWARHEKSLHLNMEEWVCAPHGGSVMLPLTGRVHCAFCSALDPSHEHLESHNYSACQNGSNTPRTFRRKDHLVQHLRLVHSITTLPLLEDWKVVSAPIRSRCGFCDASLPTWDERTDHLAAHFKAGKTMSDWKGEHGFDPDVYERIHYDYPPYLIAHQSTTLVPFSATNHASIEHTKQTISRIRASSAEPAIGEVHVLPTDPAPVVQEQVVSTRLFADVLTRHLAGFARQQMALGVVPTDEMFQRESRRVLYQDADDDWNQTVADDPEWIRKFREGAGFSGDGNGDRVL
jgi:hypothetical protein